MAPIDITPADLETVRQILRKEVPDLEVRVFGSRVSWTARETSDLDLVLMTEEPLDISHMTRLKESFSESNLPFRVDIADWADTSENFRGIIESKSVTLPSGDKTWEINHEEKEDIAIKWKEVSIGEIAEVVGGGTPSTKDIKNFNGNIPWLTPKDLAGFHDRYISRGTRNLSQKGLNNCSAKLLPKGTVLLSTRAPIGYVAIAKNPIATNQGFHSLVLRDGFLPEYIYYWMIANIKLLENYACGTTFTELSGSNLKQIRLWIPSIAIQESIAQVLGTLDDKIELNCRMSRTLETIACALFKSWFIDFDPVRAKMEGRWYRGKSLPGLPAHLYDIFPSRLVNSELGEIPEGWKVRKTSDLAIIKGGSQLQKKDILITGPVPVFGGAGLMGFTKEHNASGYVITVGRVGAYCGRFFAHRGKVWVNNNASLIVPNDDIPSEWLLFSLQRMNIDLIVKGAAQPFVSNSDLMKTKMIVPTNNIFSAFQSLTQSLILAKEHKDAESSILVSLREILLPKLISGKLQVKNAGTC